MLCTITCCLALFSCTNEKAKEKLPESLRVTVGGGTLTIEPTTENAIYIEAEGGFRLQGFVEDGVLEIIMVSKSSFASDYEPAKVTLYLPEM